MRTQAGDRDVRTYAAHSELFGQMLAEANHAGRVRLEILALGRESTIRTNEEEIIPDERIERLHIGSKLCLPEASLELDDFWVGWPHQDSGKQRRVGGHFRSRCEVEKMVAGQRSR